MVNGELGGSDLANESNNAVENKSTGDSRAMLPDSIYHHKKRKVSPTPKSSDIIIPRSPSPSIVSPPNPDRASHSPQDKAATSRHPVEPSTTMHKHTASISIDAASQAPAFMNSNAMNPTATPYQDSAKPYPNGHDVDGSSGGILVGKSKRARVPSFKSQLKTEKQGPSRSNESRVKKGTDRPAGNAALHANQEAEKVKRAQGDQEKLMTPFQYAAILKDKWHARVSNTPLERLFLKNKVIYLVFEEQNKSTKDTRIKLDIVSEQCHTGSGIHYNLGAYEQIARSGGQVATRYDPEIVTHIIPGGSTITLKKTLRALGLKSLSEIPPNIHTVKWDWIVSGLSVSLDFTIRSLTGLNLIFLFQNGTPDSEIMHESYKQRIAQKYPKRQERDDIKGKGKANSRYTTTEHSVIECVSPKHFLYFIHLTLDLMDRDFISMYDSQDDGENDTLRTKDCHGTSSVLQSNVEASSLHVQTEQKEDPLLPFYTKARLEAETAVCLA